MSNFSITLSPLNTFDARARSFKLGEREFKLAVRLVEQQGFRPNIVGGIDRRDVAPFADHLHTALVAEQLDEQDRRILGQFADYLTGDAGRTRGLTISRGWK
jgi:hypothetical protein